MIPDIIKDKIEWYIWKRKQREICREYGERVKTYSDIICFDHYGGYNYRRLLCQREWWEQESSYIWNKKGYKVGELSKNY